MVFTQLPTYTLSIGDAWYSGDGDFNSESSDYANAFIELAHKASKFSIGHLHASNLNDLYNTELYPKSTIPELDLARWHQSAYLLGTLDLRDYSLLKDRLNPADSSVFANVMEALSHAANRDFLANLRDKQRNDFTQEDELKAANKARQWWQSYINSSNTKSTWLSAVLSGFADAGYQVTVNMESIETRSELVLALDSNSHIIRYNAYKLLNYLFNTHFDIERIFLGGKYAISPYDPTEYMEAYEERLSNYWKDRLLNQKDS